MIKYIFNIFKLLRVYSWIKNLLIFAPLVFSLHLFNPHDFINSCIAFIIFCFGSSIIYIINDIIDRKGDMCHPRKKNRPLVTKEISIQSAYIIIGIIFILFIFLLSKTYLSFNVIILIYLFLNILYTYILKKINLIDIITIPLFFILRVLGGCFIIDVKPSEWIIVVTFFVSLFLTIIKRKSELLMMGSKAELHRNVLKYYNVETLNVYIYITATITIFSYILYTVDKNTIYMIGTSNMIYTSLFVILGLFRFIQLSYASNDNYNSEGDPTFLIIKDRFIQFILICWILSVLLILYIK